MKIKFYKYHGAGNDFVIIDGRKQDFPYKNKTFVKKLCDRRFGIGTDGLIILTKPKDKNSKFNMVFLNNDGSIGSMCGNGGRCIVRFAHDLRIIKQGQKINFTAVDGIHVAILEKGGIVNLKMIDMAKPIVKNKKDFTVCGTTPHYIEIVKDIKSFPLFSYAQKFRDSVKDTGGINLNIVEQEGNSFLVRTYERGVEDETYACGTGACSVATYLYENGYIKNPKVKIKMPGGILNISFTPTKDGFHNVWLSGPTAKVFEGTMEI